MRYMADAHLLRVSLNLFVAILAVFGLGLAKGVVDGVKLYY
jgi:hypothetical protein